MFDDVFAHYLTNAENVGVKTTGMGSMFRLSYRVSLNDVREGKAFIDALRDGIDWSCVPAYLVGTAVALVTGVLSIHLMRYIGKKRRFGGFAYYCWVIGVLSIILYLIF